MAKKTKKSTGPKPTPPSKPKTNSALLWSVNPLPGAGQYVNSVAISADASVLVAGTYYFNYGTAAHTVAADQSFTVGVFAYSKSNLLLWKDEFSASEGVYWVAVSRDEQWAAAGGLELHGQGFISAYNATTGVKLIDYKTSARTNMVALNSNGSWLVAGADSLYIFSRTGATWNSVPRIIKCIQANDSVISVAISGDGAWVVAGTLKGTVMLINNMAGATASQVTWQLPGGSVHWMAMASDGSSFAAGGSDPNVYYFTVAGFQTTQAPAWTGALTGCTNCRSVAVSDDGTFVSAVANKGNAGMVFLFGPSGVLKWSHPTQYSPNSTSMDSLGKFVTVAAGYPDGSPGAFQYFNSAGQLLWSYPTSNMSWPMQISANANGIAAASDDSLVYYFS